MVRFFTILILLIFIASCKKEDKDSPTSGDSNSKRNWLLNNEYLRLATDAIDNIQSFDYPQFESTYGIDLDNGDIVYVYRYEEIVKIYPQHILAQHEIVNDRIGNHYYCITYCPLTGSAVAWNREIDGKVTEFGVSGHLYHNNLIAYDRNTHQYWSQMYTLNINGVNSGDRLDHEALVRSDWIMARNSFPGAQVLIPDSSYVCNDTICNVPGDTRKTEEQLVYGIVDQGIDYTSDKVIMTELPDNLEFAQTTNFNIGNKSGFVITDPTHNVISAFYYSYSGQIITIDEKNVPLTFSDNNGNNYDITGYIFSGPDHGSRLESPLSYGAKIFAWEGFYNL